MRVGELGRIDDLLLNFVHLFARRLTCLMKFPVIGEGIDHAGPVDPKTAAMSLEYVINPSLEIVGSWIQKNEAQGGILAGQRAGALIIDAQSAEEIGGMLLSLPFWGPIKWTVIPYRQLGPQ